MARESAETDFTHVIGDHKQEILAEWERRARELPGAGELPRPVLIDSVPELFDSIVEAASELAQGHEPGIAPPGAESHSLERIHEGFRLSQVVAEYTALRESILRSLELEHAPPDAARLVHEVLDRAIAAAVENYSVARERTLRALTSISSVTLQGRDLDELLRSLLAAFAETTLAVDTASILLREGERLRVRAAVGIEEQLEHGFTIEIGEGFAGRVAARRVPLQVSSAWQDPFQAALIRKARVRAIYGVPLLHEGELLGVAQIGSRSLTEFSEHDKQLFVTMLDRATGAVSLHMLRESADRVGVQSREALAQLDALFSAVPTGMAFLDSELKYLRVNRTLARLHGLSPEQHAGRRIREVLHGEAAALEPLLRRVLDSGEPVFEQEIGMALPGAGGELRQLMVSCFPVAVGKGKWGVGTMVTDVTERRTADQKRSRLVDILELGDGCLVVDREFRVVFANRALAQLLMTALESIDHQLLWDVWPALGKPTSKFWIELQRVMSERVTSRFEGHYPPLDMWTDVTAYPTRDGGLSMFLRDATQRKRAEAALRESEHRYRLAIEATDLGTWDFEPFSQNIDWSEQSRAILGIPRDQALSYGALIERVHVDDRAHVEGLVARSFDPAGGGVFETELRITRGSDGAQRWVAARGRTLFDPSGRPTRMLGTLLDITESKLHALRVDFLAEVSKRLSETLELERTLQAVVELSVASVADISLLHLLGPDGELVLVASAPRDPELAPRVVELGESLTRSRLASWGPRRAVTIGQPELVADVADPELRLVFSPEQQALFLELGLRSLLSAPLQARNRVLGVITLASQQRPYEFADLPVVGELAMRGALAIDNAQLYESAQRAIRTRENVLAMVSHDLRNPLGVITMNASLLQRKVPSLLDDPSLRKHIEAIRRATTRMDHLIGDLSDMASIQAGRLAVEMAWEAMPPLLQEVVSTHEPLVRERGMQLRADLRCDGAFVWCDRDRLLQVFSNLIGNAMKFCRPGDRITVAADLSGSQMICSVSDTGPGIPEEDQPFIFEAYWSARRQHVRGTGLGLFISQGIVSAHGGRLTVESRPGQGTTFRFSLPYTKQPAGSS